MDFTLDNIVAGFLVRLTESIMIVVVIVILRVEFAALVFWTCRIESRRSCSRRVFGGRMANLLTLY